MQISNRDDTGLWDVNSAFKFLTKREISVAKFCIFVRKIFSTKSKFSDILKFRGKVNIASSCQNVTAWEA